MELPLFQVDAFSDRAFRGNPAAVVPLESWLDDELLQAIAAENNLSETAFLVRQDDRFKLRWFTPTVEVDLCGHATLAAALVVCQRLQPGTTTVRFATASGELTVNRAESGRYRLDLPSRPPQLAETPPGAAAALGVSPVAWLQARKALVLLDSEEQVRALVPDLRWIEDLETDGLIVTAAGTDADFVSRYFAPHAGIDEDPVTGSAHCTLTPFWTERLGKSPLFARQVSARGGELWCSQQGDRVYLEGNGVPVVEGTLFA